MAFTPLESQLLLRKIQDWLNRSQSGVEDVSGDISQAVKATETQVKAALESFRLQLIATAEQTIVSLEGQIDNQNDEIGDLTP